jgi:Fur family zinc uptake transcriptional regulator
MSFPVPHHDHGQCVAQALARAEAHCRATGGRLTDIRRRVLELVWASHQPVGAYALLDRLAKDGTRAQPPTVYRALEFLQEHGLVHRIALLNAYVGCPHPGHAHGGMFLLCKECGMAAELEEGDIASAVAQSAARSGFSVIRQTVEVEGICSACRDRGPP